MSPGKRTLVVGIGNDFGGDDAAGLLAVRALAGRVPGGVELLEHSGDGMGLIESWKGFDQVFVIDAVRSGAEPGHVHRWTGDPDPPITRAASTHALGLDGALRLAGTLGLMPPVIVVYGVEGSHFSASGKISEDVRKGVNRVAERIAAELRAPVVDDET